MRSNSELLNIILGDYSRTEKQEAGQQLLTQSPSNSDLRYIIKLCDNEIKLEAAYHLRKMYGVEGSLDEVGLMKSIAETVLERPGSLRMDKWHCGTAHCVAGWACVLSEHAKKIESASDTETAGYAMLPSFSHLFFVDNNQALTELKKVAAL